MTVTSAPAPSPDLVVGLGASVGELEALQAFFAAIPPDTGLVACDCGSCRTSGRRS